MDVYQRIYSHLRRPQDAATFASLCKATHVIMVCSKQRWALSVTERACEHGIFSWIDRHATKVQALTFKRCVYSPNFRVPSRAPLDTLRFLYCRVFPRTFSTDLSSLKHLTIHQLMSGEDPGCMTPLINACPSLQQLSITFASHWGIASVGPLLLPNLTDLDLRHPHGTLLYHHGEHACLQKATLHASELDLPSNQRFPDTCTSLSIRSIDSFLDPNDCVPSSLKTLDIVTKGMVFPALWNHTDALETLICQCDSFFLSPLPRALTHFEVDVSLCFVCINMYEDDVAHFQNLPYTRTTERQCVVDLLPFLI